MVGMAKPKRFVGVERHEEIDIKTRRDDARSFRRRSAISLIRPKGRAPSSSG